MSDRFVELTTRSGEADAQFIANLLNAEGLETDVRPSEGGLYGIFGHASLFPHTVYVRRSVYESAQSILTHSVEDSVDIDWDTVDVGRPDDELSRAIASDGNEGWKPKPRWLYVAVLYLAFVPLFFATRTMGGTSWMNLAVMYVIFALALVFPVVVTARARA